MSTDSTMKIIKDSTIKNNNFVEKTTTITIDKVGHKKVDYYSKTLDFISSISWPLFIIIIFLMLRKSVLNFLNALIEKIKHSKEFSITKDGIIIAAWAKDKIPCDKDQTISINVSESLSSDSSTKEILSTLWIQQCGYDSSFNTRWTFTLGTNSPNYLSFSLASKRLQWLGLIAYDQINGQFFLTDLGIKFCQDNSNKLGTFSYFKQ